MRAAGWGPSLSYQVTTDRVQQTPQLRSWRMVVSRIVGDGMVLGAAVVDVAFRPGSVTVCALAAACFVRDTPNGVVGTHFHPVTSEDSGAYAQLAGATGGYYPSVSVATAKFAHLRSIREPT